MPINQRRHIRLTLDIPAFRFSKAGEKISTLMYQISIGGCLIEWDEGFKKDEIFRLEIQLPNKNWLPLQCKVLYLVKEDGIGAQFQDISQFEQELIVQVMSETLAEEGIPMKVDPFSQPKFFDSTETKISEIEYKVEEESEEISEENLESEELAEKEESAEQEDVETAEVTK